jgi:hypothetical protein
MLEGTSAMDPSAGRFFSTLQAHYLDAHVGKVRCLKHLIGNSGNAVPAPLQLCFSAAVNGFQTVGLRVRRRSAQADADQVSAARVAAGVRCRDRHHRFVETP